MKQLTGTEKQIKWAEDIRAEKIAEMRSAAPGERGMKIIDHLENKIGNAEWWINHRTYHYTVIAKKMIEKHGY